jgi:hypothetical protein
MSGRAGKWQLHRDFENGGKSSSVCCFTWNAKQTAVCLFHVKHAACEDGKKGSNRFHVKRGGEK